MLSKECEECTELKACSRRYSKAGQGDKIYCPDGAVHVVTGTVQALDFCCFGM